MKDFTSKRKTDFLDRIPIASIESKDNNLVVRCKFNFSYFEKQNAGIGFDELSQEKLVKLLVKLKEYGRESLKYWENQAVGKSGSVYANYGAFPSKSEFEHPKHIPHEADWGRFRIDHSTRLCGFTIPRKFEDFPKTKEGRRFCSNTFYIVFLDPYHKFYQSGNEEH